MADFEKMTKDLGEVLSEERDLLNIREERLKQAKATVEVENKLLKIQIQRIENLIKEKKLEARTAQEKERKKVLEEIVALEEQLEKANEKLKKSEEALQESKEKNFKTTLKQIEVYGKLESAMKILKNPYAALGKALNYLIELSIAATKTYDEQRAALAKLTGGLSRYNQELADGMNQASLYGVTMEEFGKSFNDAAAELTSFGSLNASTRKEIGLLAGQMGRLGMDNFLKNLEMGVQGLGMTQDQAMETQKELLGLGSALGPKFKKMIDAEFGPAMESLAAHTKGKAIKVFKELAIQSKKTGLELSKLRAFSEQFDTFEGAASAVGKLNAALGGNYFNSMELLKASESERVDIIRQGIALSGKRFQDLSRFEKKFMAQALGVSSVADAQKLLRTEQEKEAEELERLTKQGEKFGLSAEEMRERIRATQKVSEQFKMAMQNLAVAFKPVIDFLSKVAKGLADVTKFMKKNTNSTGALVTALGALFGILLLYKGIGGIIGAVIGGGKKGTRGLSKMGLKRSLRGSLGGLVGGLKTLALGAAAVGVAIVLMGLLGKVLPIFSKGLKSLETISWEAMGKAAAGLTVITVAIVALGALLTKGTLGMGALAFGAAVLAIALLGGAFYALGTGISSVAEGFKKLEGVSPEKIIKKLANIGKLEGIEDAAKSINKLANIGKLEGIDVEENIEKLTNIAELVTTINTSGVDALKINLNKIQVEGDLDYKFTVDFENIPKSRRDMEKKLKDFAEKVKTNTAALAKIKGSL
jgi:hypothetical protein